MQIYAIKLFNFFRFHDKNNCVILDILSEFKDIPLDDLYEKIRKNPVEYIKKAKQNITNLTSIAGIIGNDFDFSNGTGKSTILEAITYAFFEQVVRKTANNDKTEKITAAIATKINGQHPKDLKEAYVEIIFEENNKVYVLKRGRAFSKNYATHTRILKFECINEDGVDSREGHRTTDTDESVLGVINTNYDLFVNSILFGQMDSGKFLSGTDGVRKEMLIQMLRFDSIVNSCLGKVRDKKNAKAEEIKILDAQISLMVDDIKNKPLVDVLEKQIIEKESLIKESSESSIKLRDRLNILSNSDVIKELESIKTEGARVKGDLASKKKEKESRVQEWVNLFNDAEKSIAKKLQEINDLSRSKKDLENRIEDNKSKIDGFNLEERNKDLGTVEKARQAKPKYSDDIIKMETQKIEISKSMSSYSTKMDIAKDEIKLLQSQLKKSGDQFVCDRCKSVVTKKHIESELLKNEELVKSLGNEYNKYDNEYRKLLDTISDKRKKYEQIEGWLIKEGKINGEIKDYQNKKEKQKELELSLSNYATLSENLVKEKNDFDSKKNQYSTKIKEIGENFESEINALTDSLNKLGEKFKQLDGSASSIKKETEDVKEKLEVLSKNKSLYNTQIGSMRKEINTIEEDRKKIDELRAKSAGERKILNRLVVLDSCLGLEGIQTRIVNKYLPLLNVYIAEFMGVLSGGTMSVNLIVSDKAKIEIAISGGSANSFEMLSGGEKTICRLAVSVSLAMLSFTRCNQKPEFIALDELFSSLDESHVDTAFKLLKKLQDKFARVIVISHKAEINALIPHQILVEKDEGMYGRSRIRSIS